jgi:hypothetical protein
VAELRAQLNRVAAFAAVGVLSALPAAAETFGVETIPGTTAELPTIGIRLVVTNVLRGFLGLLGVFVVSQIVWAVFLLMTHGGNYDRKHKAEVTLKHSVLALFVVLASSSLLRLVVNTLFDRSGLEYFL